MTFPRPSVKQIGWGGLELLRFRVAIAVGDRSGFTFPLKCKPTNPGGESRPRGYPRASPREISRATHACRKDTGVKITDAEMKRLSIHKDKNLPKWNYTITPRKNGK